MTRGEKIDAITCIRRATIEDVAAILDISNYYALHSLANFAVGSEDLETWLHSFQETHDRYPWLVATVAAGDGLNPADAQCAAGAVIGFARASPWLGRCAYHYTAQVTVYVRPENRGRGVGRLLYGRLLTLLRAQGYRTVIAGIAQPNPASVRLHESFGMTLVGTFRRVGWKFGAWHDVGYWQIVLNESSEAMPARIRSVAETARELDVDAAV